MALTKIGSIGINTGIKFAGVTTITTLNSATDTLTIGGPVSIAGTLTYEDVTNVDSIGVVTARDGIKVGSGITLSKDGDIFFTGIMTGNGSGLTGVANTDVIFTDKITLPDSTAGSINVGLASDLQIYHDGSNSYIKEAGTGNLQIQSANVVEIEKDDGTKVARFHPDGAVQLYNNGNVKLETASGGVTVTGTVAATAYTGDGSALTGVSSPNLAATETQGYQNLKILTTTNASTVVTCDSVLLTNSSGVLIKVDNVNVTIDSGASGLNGLDTGSRATQKVYYVWIINNGSGTTGAILSLSSTSPTLPSGYTYYARVGAVSTSMTTTDLNDGIQVNNTYSLQYQNAGYDRVRIRSASGSSSDVQISVPMVPATAAVWQANGQT